VSAQDLLLALIEPHPELVAVQRPTPREVCEAAAYFGLLRDPDERFRPVVSA
jgi:hypothetical protein